MLLIRYLESISFNPMIRAELQKAQRRVSGVISRFDKQNMHHFLLNSLELTSNLVYMVGTYGNERVYKGSHLNMPPQAVLHFYMASLHKPNGFFS